jgi:small conductance mechanosensitive channel
MSEFIRNLKSVLQHWEKSIIDELPNIFGGILIVVLFYFLAKSAKKITLSFYAKTIKKDSGLANIIGSFIYFFFLCSGVFLALQLVGYIQILTHLLAGAGIVGIVAGFAFKDVASNLFAGLLLKMQDPYRENDWVEIDSNYGYVLEVGWITTKIHTVPGQEVFVPNQLVYSNTFKNYSTFKKRRIILETGVSYGDDLDHVKAVALDEAKKSEDILQNENIDFYFTEIGSSSYNFQLRFWIKFESNDDYRKAMSNIIMRIKKRFEEEKISIAYAVTTLDFGVKGGVNLFDKEVMIKE